MKITIDTKEDSHQDLKKVIRFLLHILGEDVYEENTENKNIFEDDSTPGVGSGLMGMFGDDSEQEHQEEPKEPDLPIKFFDF